MRSKEDSLDYRYFPEPDLPTLKVDNEFLQTVQKNLVESPFSRIRKYKEEYGFNKEYISALINDLDVNNYFEDTIKA